MRINTMSQIFFTPEQTAEMLFVSPHTLAVWRSTGRYDLPFVKFGWKVRYKKDDIEAFIEKRTRNKHSSAS